MHITGGGGSQNSLLWKSNHPTSALRSPPLALAHQPTQPIFTTLQQRIVLGQLLRILWYHTFGSAINLLMVLSKV